MKPAILLGKPVPLLSLTVRYILSTPKVWISLLFVTFYLLAIQYCRIISYRDPTSLFWDPARGYDKIYSIERKKQAEVYIRSQEDLARSNTTLAKAQKSDGNPPLCLGVATVGRPDQQYIRTTVGSLLGGLDDSERQSIHFIFFIAHTDPHVHPISYEKWTETVPDTLLGYDVNATELARIKQWEHDKDYKTKGLYDYAYLLQQCYRTGASYTAMIEGDVLAVDGWYARALAATDIVEGQSPSLAGQAASWLYIRMFYTEAYLGWNSEEWPHYLGVSFLIFLLLTASLISVRACFPSLQRLLSNPTLAVINLIYLPACILLYFFAGRVTVQPPAIGVHPMDNYGCCSQGFIFSRRMIPLVVDRIQRQALGFIDMLMEATAGDEGFSRWVIVPSLLQHVGGVSSKGDAVADSRAKMIWNFGFEMYDAATLKQYRPS